jgi:hypothetical protein
MKPLLFTFFISFFVTVAHGQNATTRKIDSLVSVIDKAGFPSIGSDSNYLTGVSSAREKQTWFGDSLRNQVSRMVYTFQEPSRKIIYAFYLFNSAIIRVDITHSNNCTRSTNHIYYHADKVIFHSKNTNEAETALLKGKEILQNYYHLNYLEDYKMERQ